MLRWFADFDHIVFYVTIKLVVLSLLLVLMWMLIDHHFQAIDTPTIVQFFSR